MAEGMFYNATAGYLEGIVRGYRSALLSGQQYSNLTQCESIDGTTATPHNQNVPHALTIRT